MHKCIQYYLPTLYTNYIRLLFLFIFSSYFLLVMSALHRMETYCFTSNHPFLIQPYPGQNCFVLKRSAFIWMYGCMLGYGGLSRTYAFNMSSSNELILSMAESWGQVKGNMFQFTKQSSRAPVTIVPLVLFQFTYAMVILCVTEFQNLFETVGNERRV